MLECLTFRAFQFPLDISCSLKSMKSCNEKWNPAVKWMQECTGSATHSLLGRKEL